MASFIKTNQEEIEANRTDIRLGHGAPPVNTQIDLLSSTEDPNTLYPETQWIKVDEGTYENVSVNTLTAPTLGITLPSGMSSTLISVPYFKWLRIK
jgi:hypothetical protein